MFGGNNCEKMVAVVTPQTASNKWTQTQQIDDHKAPMMGRVMEKPSQDLLQQQQQALKCPRCESSNTKFCYYNNYSLSQPRHFCKACKRYWTRGGTLRNVPVGGGCRKNKRVKRPTNHGDSSSSAANSPSSSNSNPPSQPHIDNIIASSSTTNHINNISPFFYGGDVMSSVPFPRFNLHSQLNALGLGFSTGVSENGFSTSNNNSFFSAYNSMFGSSSSSTCAPSTPVMASLLSSTLLQQKLMSGGGGGGVKGSSDHDQGGNTFHGLAPLQGLQVEGNNNNSNNIGTKEVRGEGQNRFDWSNNNNNNNGGGGCQNQMEHVGLSDPNSLYWNTATGLGAWSDQPNNIGPSVTSLI
ncbi:hypothetical protein GLYMA_13G177500v4 [Glycine max]|uniref:Dof zinc finger protein n=2 Tax=Glycine max TaxID=3847 RepID=I1M087_SOYBN|nr:dof zinc finger protein DOF1.4 [Glycine max]KAG4383918.1 hypothetical protein GLYMA_13G177500v4 [Glycine max]KAH1102068.1 hypothetical protein GYH30_036566 [Glycine max]KAH1102069.1 hypothetical protein GYH30_036566 [Glycine max]KRH20416.1 hypothetical protein GLYMA_13G177500v4 [Glycine max]|eukprot:XP_003541529.2 dof zinc finger protein DOF1.4 [Glycine max]